MLFPFSKQRVSVEDSLAYVALRDAESKQYLNRVTPSSGLWTKPLQNRLSNYSTHGESHFFSAGFSDKLLCATINSP